MTSINNYPGYYNRSPYTTCATASTAATATASVSVTTTSTVPTASVSVTTTGTVPTSSVSVSTTGTVPTSSVTVQQTGSVTVRQTGSVSITTTGTESVATGTTEELPTGGGDEEYRRFESNYSGNNININYSGFYNSNSTSVFGSGTSVFNQSTSVFSSGTSIPCLATMASPEFLKLIGFTLTTTPTSSGNDIDLQNKAFVKSLMNAWNQLTTIHFGKDFDLELNSLSLGDSGWSMNINPSIGSDWSVKCTFSFDPSSVGKKKHERDKKALNEYNDLYYYLK